MTFFKIRFHSILFVAFAAYMALGQCGGNLFAQPIPVNDLAGLKTAFNDIAGMTSGSVTIQISGQIAMDGTLPELYVPAGVDVIIENNGNAIINGQGTHRGFVIQTESGSTVEITGITFQNCVATGGDGGDGQVGGGGGAGLGGAIYVRGVGDSVTLTDVAFKDNAAVGGNGGSVVKGSNTAGGGGGMGGDGGSGSAGVTGYAAGGGGGFGEEADGGLTANGGSGTLSDNSSDAGDGFVIPGSGNSTNGGTNGGGGGGAVADSTNNNAAAGGGGDGGSSGDRTGGNFFGGDGGFGGGGGGAAGGPGSTAAGGDGGLGGGGGGGSSHGGDGGFGGGGGGSLTNNVGVGGLGAGNGGNDGSGGGGLGAGAAVFVEGNVALFMNYTGASGTFSNNTSQGGVGTGNAGSGEGLSEIFLYENGITFGSTYAGNTSIKANISDISALAGTNATDWQAHGGGVTITNGSVVFEGDNHYAGVTTIENNATLIANGKTGNAIGDLSQVDIESGSALQINKNETIAFLSGDGEVKLSGGTTLTIGGNEDVAGINPATGQLVGTFDGTIATDGNANTKEQLVKTGTGRLVLNNDNSNVGDEFTTTIYQGTVVLGDSKALGGGNVTVKNIDTGTGSNLRNVIEANTDLTGLDAVTNNFAISSGKTETGGTYGAMVIGGANDIQFGDFGTAAGGQISGGNLLINMAGSGNKVILANQGFDGSSNYVSAKANNYAETQIKSGTLVVHEGQGGANDTLGYGSVRILEGSGNNAQLSAADIGMTIDNSVIIENNSNLTLTNEGIGTDYTLSGIVSGKGGLIVDLSDDGDTVTLSQNPAYQGATHIETGTLNFANVNAGTLVQLYDLSATTSGSLIVNSANLGVAITDGATVTYSGSIDAGSNKIVKSGAGTWVLNASTSITSADSSVDVIAGALQLDADGIVDKITLAGNGKLIVNSDVSLADLVTGTYTNTNVTINSPDTLTLTSGTDINLYNSWSGDGTVMFERNANLYNDKYKSWDGTMEVAAGVTLAAMKPGTLGINGTVVLNTGSTLKIDTADPMYYPIAETINTLDVQGDSTLNVVAGNRFLAENITGSDDLTKTGAGVWHIDSDLSGAYSGDVHLQEGTLHLQRKMNTVTNLYDYDANWGDGDLIVDGIAGTPPALMVDVDATVGSKTIDKDIILNSQNLSVGIVDYSNTGTGEVLFSNGISGTGGINFNGGGVMVFDTTAKTYTGGTNIYGGTLRVDGVTTATNYTVNNGGTLELLGANLGTNDVTVGNGGTLTGTGAIGIDNMKFDAGSRFIADLGTGVNYTATNVDITSGAIAHITGSNTADKTLLNATTGTGMFWFTDEVQGKRAVGEWNSGNLDITYEDVNYQSNAYTWNANSAASYLSAIADNSFNGQPWNPIIPLDTETAILLNNLENILPGDYDYAMLELGGQINPSLVTAQMQTTSNMFRTLVTQLRPQNLVWDDTSRHLRNGYNLEQVDYRGQSMRSGWTGWTSSLGILGDTSGHGGRGTFGYDFETYGMSIGIEPTYAMSRNRLGFFYAYNYTQIDTNMTIGNGHAKSNFFGSYGRFVDGMGYTAFVAGFGFDDYKTNRYVNKPLTGGHSRSEFDGWQGGFYLERGLSHVAWTRLGLQPFAGLQYLHISTDDFTESGTNPYKLATQSADADSLRTNLGVRYSQCFTGKRGKTLQFGATASWMHEFLDADCMMTSKWAVTQNPSTFGVLGNSLGRDWAVLGANADLQWRHNINLFGSYDLQLNGYQTLHVGNVGARIQW